MWIGAFEFHSWNILKAEFVSNDKWWAYFILIVFIHSYNNGIVKKCFGLFLRQPYSPTFPDSAWVGLLSSEACRPSLVVFNFSGCTSAISVLHITSHRSRDRLDGSRWVSIETTATYSRTNFESAIEAAAIYREMRQSSNMCWRSDSCSRNCCCRLVEFHIIHTYRY